MNTYELLTRNTAEVVTEQEVRALADSPSDKRVYVGYEPSGVLHLGHLLTANKLIDLQEAGMDVVVLLADVHAHLNGKGSFEEIRETAERMKAQFIAYGLDETQTEYVYGSEFQLDPDYSLDLHHLGVETTLNRAQRAVAELQSGETATVSHTVYPSMQVLDFEYLDIDLAVGGLDQRKVHMLAREKLPELDYGVRPCLHTPILADLETGGGKMSSSEGTTISMEDSTADIDRKIESAFCPPTRDPQGDREHPIFQLFEYYVFPRFEMVTVERPEQYGGNQTYEHYESLAAALDSGDLHPSDAKATLTEYLDDLITPGREKLSEFLSE